MDLYGGIFRTCIVLLSISCARLFLFRRSFFLFYYLVRTTFLFRRSFFLFYYLVRTTFLFCVSFFLFYYLVRTTFFRMSFFLFFCLVRTTYWFIFWWKATFKPDSRPTPDKCRPIYIAWSGMIGKKITRSDWRAYISPINTRCIRAVSLMHPCSNLALPDLPPSFRLTNSRSARPTPDLFLIQLRSLRSI